MWYTSYMFWPFLAIFSEVFNKEKYNNGQLHTIFSYIYVYILKSS